MLFRFTHQEHVQGSEQHLHGPKWTHQDCESTMQQHARTTSAAWGHQQPTPRALSYCSILVQYSYGGQVAALALNQRLQGSTCRVHCNASWAEMPSTSAWSVTQPMPCLSGFTMIGGLRSPPVYLPPAPAHAMRENPTASGVMLPWPGLAIPQAYTVLIRVNVITTCGNSSTASLAVEGLNTPVPTQQLPLLDGNSRQPLWIGQGDEELLRVQLFSQCSVCARLVPCTSSTVWCYC